MIIKTFEGDVGDGGLVEDWQEVNILYQVVKLVDGAYIPIMPLAKCKDYLNDIIYSNYTGELNYPIYGFIYDVDTYPLDSDKFRIAFYGPDVHHIVDNFSLIKQFNKAVGMSPPVLEHCETRYMNTGIVITSDARWQRSSFLCSLYYSIIRSCAVEQICETFDEVELEDTIFNNIDNLGGIDYVASKLLEWTDRTPANDGVGDVYIPDDYDEEYDEEYNIPENMWGNTEVHDFGFNGVIDSMYNGNRGPKSVIATRIYEDLLGDNNISVFVYGTLKTNFCNNSILKDSGAKRAGENVCIYGYHMYNTGSGYPAVCETAGASTSPVVGEVWFVNKDTLDRLDILEGVPHLYKRESINTHYGSTYIYVYNQEISGMRRVTGGRWEK